MKDLQDEMAGSRDWSLNVLIENEILVRSRKTEPWCWAMGKLKHSHWTSGTECWRRSFLDIFLARLDNQLHLIHMCSCEHEMSRRKLQMLFKTTTNYYFKNITYLASSPPNNPAREKNCITTAPYCQMKKELEQNKKQGPTDERQ